MPRRYTICLCWFVIVTLASFLRLHDLADRPIHADEATGARILADRLNNDHYIFNPKHFHGPLLSLTSEPIARLRGETTWSELSLSTLRIGPAIVGILLVITPLLWQRYMGAFAAIGAGALLATSPLLVYYSRMYIHETWLALLGILSCAALFRFLQKANTRNAIVTGLSIGLMFATKETFAISILSWTVAAIALATLQSSAKQFCFPVKPLLILSLVGLALATYFYSDGFRNPRGIFGALQTFFTYETTPGHEKPIYYYAALLVWPKHSLGIWWSEAFVFTLAIAASVIAIKQRSASTTFLLIGAGTHFLIYSFIPYKTPWLMLLPWALACLVAGTLFSYWPKFRAPIKITISILMATGITYQTMQSLRAIGSFSNDARNPYAYVPTSRDASKIKTWLADLAAMPNVPHLEPIAVIGNGYWPLPWYLRDFDKIGYWPEPSSENITLPIVFSMPEQIDASDALLLETHTRLPRSLRSNVPIVLYLRNDIWTQWIEQPIQ